MKQSTPTRKRARRGLPPALLDVNVLLALAWPNHQHHEAAHRWFSRESRHGWATCAMTQLAFVRLSSNPSYTPAAVPPTDAATLLAQFVAHGRHRFWSEMPSVEAKMFRNAVGHQQVVDAYLVHLAGHHGGRIATLDERLSAHAHDTSVVHVIEA